MGLRVGHRSASIAPATARSKSSDSTRCCRSTTPCRSASTSSRTFEGANNLQGNLSPAVGAIVSRRVSKYAALYAEPIVVFNTNPLDSSLVSSNDTFMLGLGGRLRIRPSTYIVGEFTPRLAGYTPGVGLISFGLEGRAGGHLFQVNFSNGIGTTLGQIARGSVDNNSWFIGFNISRKFF